MSNLFSVCINGDGAYHEDAINKIGKKQTADYASAWLYVLTSVNNAWRHTDIIYNLTQLNLERIKIRSIEQLREKDLTLDEAKIEQKCETDILDVSGCMFGCRHWRISKEEFVAKKELIIKLIVTKRKKVHELHNFMTSLHDKILSKEYQNNIPTLLTELTTTAKLIDHEVKNLARYKGNPLGGGAILHA